MLVYELPGTLETREAHLDLLWDAGATGLEERTGVIRAYFDEQVTLPAAVADGSWREEADQDWQAEFKANLKPVQAGRVTIVPPWLPDVSAGQVRLIIEPGMAFGTGHHATTRMAVEALSALDLFGKRVLDVGTGSGVLAIAAALLGAELGFGVDIDPITVPIARENALINEVPAGRTRFEEGALGEELPGDVAPDGQFDVLVANLYAELHDLLAGEYVAHLRPGAPLILTGILTGKLPLVREALAREGFTRVRVQEDGDWTLVTANAPEDELDAVR